MSCLVFDFYVDYLMLIRLVNMMNTLFQLGLFLLLFCVLLGSVIRGFCVVERVLQLT